MFADGHGNPVDLVTGLIRGVNERRILMHLFAPDEQAVIAGTTIAGEVDEAPSDTPQVGVYLNDGTGAKMSFFLDHEVQVTSVSCENGRQTLTARLQVTSDTPPDVAQLPRTVVGFADGFGDSVQPGDQLVVADLYAPAGGTIREIAFNGEPLPDPAVDHYRGRDVVSLGLPLDPGQTRIVTWTMVTGPGQTAPTEVSVTPGPGPRTSPASPPRPASPNRGPSDQIVRRARATRDASPYCRPHVLDLADQAPRGGSLPRPLGAVSNVLSGSCFKSAKLIGLL